MVKSKKIKIDPHIQISVLIDTYPQLVDVLTEDYEFHCVNCLFSDFDNLKDGAALHGVEGQDFEDMLEHLESVVNGEFEIELDNDPLQ